MLRRTANSRLFNRRLRSPASFPWPPSFWRPWPPSFWRPWPPSLWTLIATKLLETGLTHSKQRAGSSSNRDKTAPFEKVRRGGSLFSGRSAVADCQFCILLFSHAPCIHSARPVAPSRSPDNFSTRHIPKVEFAATPANSMISDFLLVTHCLVPRRICAHPRFRLSQKIESPSPPHRSDQPSQVAAFAPGR